MDRDSALTPQDGKSARWSLRLLGGFELSEISTNRKLTVPGKRERVLLSYLALSPNFRQPRRSLVRLLWGVDTSLDNLRVCVWRLRKALGDAEHCIVASGGEDIVLDGKAFEIDVLVFRRLAAGNSKTGLEEAA